MAIMPHPAPRSNGTIYGVPFLFSMEKYGYTLPDGKEFAYEEYDAMTEYVINNLPKFEKAVLDADNDDSRVKSRDSQSRERANTRFQIEQENKKIQLRWDKEFNRKVLDLVRRCVEEGTVHAAKMKSLSTADMQWTDADTRDTVGVERYTIVYPRHMTSNAAYMNVREQAEKIVKTTMEPPKLHRIP